MIFGFDFIVWYSLAWKCMFRYDTLNPDGFLTPHRDAIYADASDGTVCAQHPTIYAASAPGIPGLQTIDCGQKTTCTNSKYI
jgi:hypothetical protein